MALTYSQAPSATFAAIQERFEKKANPKSNISKSKLLTKGSGKSRDSNYARDVIFKKRAKGLIADRKYIRRYEVMLSENYLKALRLQLDVNTRGQRNGIRTRFQHVGYASGRLYKKIKTDSRVTIRHDKIKGRYNIFFSLRHDFTEAVAYNSDYYGDYLNYIRPPRKFSAYAIKEWMKQKMRLSGGLKIYNREKKKVNKEGSGSKLVSKDKLLTRIAFAIRGAMAKEVRPAVLPYWSIYDKNVKLQKDFKRLVGYKGAYHRRQIRKSIMKNLLNDA